MDEKDLNRTIGKWDIDFKADPNLTRRIHREIRLGKIRDEEGQQKRNSTWLESIWPRSMAIAGAATFILALGFGLAKMLESPSASQAQSLSFAYRASIDPLYRLEQTSYANGTRGPSETETLSWIREEFDLGATQFETLRMLHERHRTNFEALFVELLGSREIYRQLDEQRMRDDALDFIALYELLQKEKQLREESLHTTEQLIRKVSELMKPPQQNRYLELIRSTDSIRESPRLDV